MGLLPDHLGRKGESLRGAAERLPLSYESDAFPIKLLTEHWTFDMMHRRGGGTPGLDIRRRFAHGDNHRRCTGNCGQSSARGAGGFVTPSRWQQQKVTAWRKAKAAKNRAYLEREVYQSDPA